MDDASDRWKGACLALAGCALALAATVHLAQETRDGPARAARDDARLCLVEDPEAARLI